MIYLLWVSRIAKSAQSESAEHGRTAEPKKWKPESRDPQIHKSRSLMDSQCALESKNQLASEPVSQ